MSKAEWVLCKCLEVKQPIGTFYLAVMNSQDVVDISYADIRRIEDRDIERIVGIQRPLNATRVAELREYVTNIDAAFPSGILLSIESKNVEFHADGTSMKIRRQDEVAKIIDGQHRIAGLEGYQGKDFFLNVTIFVDMELEDQAMMFATINLKQTKVSKSLAYDLFDYAQARSPQKTCHNIARVMNSKDMSPFLGKIKILGVATEDKTETITQATFVERLMLYLTKDPMGDRDTLKRKGKLTPISAEESKTLIFRNMFIAERDAAIAKVVWNYFSAISLRWKKAWWSNERGNILNRTTGFGALMRLLRPAYLKLGTIGSVVESAAFVDLLNKVDVKDSEFTSDNYKPGTSGESLLYRELCERAGLNVSQIPDELR